MRADYRTCRTPKQLIQELAWDAFLWRALDSIKKKPGQTVQSLSPRDRELLQQLTSKDMQDARFPYA